MSTLTLDEELVLLEQALEGSIGIPCSCAHKAEGSEVAHPGAHFLAERLIEAYGLVPCSLAAVWLAYEPEPREGKRPVYLCGPCAMYWSAPPFSMKVEALN